MGIFGRRSDTLTASAAIIDLTDTTSVRRFGMAKKAWQDEAFGFYDRLAEVHYPANFIASSLSRFTLHLGRRLPGVPDPVRLDAPKPGAELAARDLLDAFESPQCSASEHLRRFGLNWTIAADMWLLGTPAKGSIDWETLSVREVSAVGNGTFHRYSNGQAVEGTYQAELPAGSFVRRIWRAHPGWSFLADGALNALANDCQRLITLNDSLTARLMSRLASNGIMVFPDNIAVNGVSVSADGKNPFFAQILNQLEQAMTGDLGAGALPIVVTGGTGTAKEIAHITMDRDIAVAEMELRKELRANIALGMDLPPEVQTGLGSSNHFSTWSIMDSSYRTHLVPVVDQATDAWTRVYLQPALKSLRRFSPEDLRGLCIIGDGENVVVRPNQSQDARELKDRDAISEKALRTRSGVTEAEAPDENEVIRSFGRKHGNAALMLWGTKAWDTITGDPDTIHKIQELQVQRGRSGAGTTPEGNVPVTSGGSNAGTEPGAGEANLAAERMAAAATQALKAADRTVGAKLRARSQAHPEVADKLKREPNEAVYGALSDEDLRRIGFSESDLLGLYIEGLSELRFFCVEQAGMTAATEYVGSLAMLKVANPQTSVSFAACHDQAGGVLTGASL